MRKCDPGTEAFFCAFGAIICYPVDTVANLLLDARTVHFMHFWPLRGVRTGPRTRLAGLFCAWNPAYAFTYRF